MKELINIDCDSVLIKKYFDYYQNNYYDSFVYGYGTEYILNSLNRLVVCGNWLDLGCGPMTLFWSIPLVKKNIASITVNDVKIEALVVLSRILGCFELPPCYKDALDMFGLNEKDFFKVFGVDWKYMVFDVFRGWPVLGWENKSGYDLITQFGCFGIAENSIVFQDIFPQLKRYLNNEGIFLGVNWIKKSKSTYDFGGDNTYLSDELIMKIADLNGFELLQCETIGVKDSHYRGILLWKMRKM